MSQSLEYFPGPIADAYLKANVLYPQMLTGVAVAMGSVATRLMVAGEYSWGRLYADRANDEQLQLAAEKIAAAHGDFIPFRVGETYAKKDGITTFPIQRVGDLMHAVTRDVNDVVGAVLGALHPHLAREYLFCLPHERPALLDDYTTQLPSSMAAISVLFGGAHAAMMAKNDMTLSIRRDTHTALRRYYKIDLESDEGKQEMRQIARTLHGTKNRFEDLLQIGYDNSLSDAEAALGRPLPHGTDTAFIEALIPGVQMPGEGSIEYLVREAEYKASQATSSAGPQEHGSV
ncbi:MAG TPA: hypothetical protein VF733_02870 [Candidatus Saccharimonadales bacterium]